MNGWFTKNLGDAMLAWQELENLKEYFQFKFAEKNFSKDFLVLMRHESEGRLHCEVKIYFSPSLSKSARELGAAPCNKPSTNGLSLLAGNETMWRHMMTDVTL
jgi:hypothetical protein